MALVRSTQTVVALMTPSAEARVAAARTVMLVDRRVPEPKYTDDLPRATRVVKLPEKDCQPYHRGGYCRHPLVCTPDD
jgi:hypothetical protein